MTRIASCRARDAGGDGIGAGWKGRGGMRHLVGGLGAAQEGGAGEGMGEGCNCVLRSRIVCVFVYTLGSIFYAGCPLIIAV